MVLYGNLNWNIRNIKDFYRRMVFNVVSRNHNDHTKNHVFLMDKTGKWALGPAYDLCYSYMPGGQWANSHQMSLNGKRDDFTYDDLITVGKRVVIVTPVSYTHLTLRRS